MTAPVRILLVRHGSVAGDGRCYGQRHDPSLDATGRAAVAELGRRLVAPEIVVASPARRATETVEALGWEARTDARWAERDFGTWEGRPWRECWDEAPSDVHASREAYAAFTPPGAETLDEVASRVHAALIEVSSGDAATVGVVTHGGPIRAAAAHVLGLDAPAQFALAPGYATVTELVRWGRSWVMERFGA